MDPTQQLKVIAAKMETAFDLAVERFEKYPDWRRHLPSTRRDISVCVAEAMSALQDMEKLGSASKDDIAKLRQHLSAFRVAYSSHQVNFLASATERTTTYRDSLQYVLGEFAKFVAEVRFRRP